MALAMTEAEFGSFLMFLKSNVPQEGLPIRKAAIYNHLETAMWTGLGVG